jgi:hypothetical protein
LVGASERGVQPSNALSSQCARPDQIDRHPVTLLGMIVPGRRTEGARPVPSPKMVEARKRPDPGHCGNGRDDCGDQDELCQPQRFALSPLLSGATIVPSNVVRITCERAHRDQSSVRESG